MIIVLHYFTYINYKDVINIFAQYAWIIFDVKSENAFLHTY